jgi:hypothetical protein
MKESQFKTMQGWFDQLNQRMTAIDSRLTHVEAGLGNIESTMAKKADLEKFRDDLDKVHGLIHQVHRRVDLHLTDDDSEKRLMRLALERLDDRVTSLEGRR